MYEITGTLKMKRETKQATDTFKVREFVLVDNSSQYPQYITLQLTQDRCELLDNVTEGDLIKVSFYLKGREWKSPEGEFRYFNSVEAWKVEPAKSSGTSNTSKTSEKVEYATADAQEDDLPF